MLPHQRQCRGDVLGTSDVLIYLHVLSMLGFFP